MKKIQNFPYNICIAVFEYNFLGDSKKIKSLFNSNASLGRFEIVNILFSSAIDEDLNIFRRSELDSVKNFTKQSDAFLATLSMIAMLVSHENGISIYHPKLSEPCLCKIGSAIIKKEAPNFSLNARALYDYFIHYYVKTAHGHEYLEKNKNLAVEIKRTQFKRLSHKYKIIKKVHDFKGSSWIAKNI
tara:strand:- start:5491 stop:6051 length:561 start_codon:yes stop_codon:yes gene_type:complete